MRFGDQRYFEGALMGAIEVAVAATTLKEFAAACDVKPPVMADRLAERNDKGLRVRDLCTLIEIAPPLAEEALVAAIIVPRGFERPRRAARLTAEQKVERYERALANAGHVGAHLRYIAIGDEP
jgi:hypothetical protein